MTGWRAWRDANSSLIFEERTGGRFGSDDTAFSQKGVPTVGLYTGAGGPKSEAGLFGGAAGRPFDPCYHRACDTTANINQEVLEQNTRALVRGAPRRRDRCADRLSAATAATSISGMILIIDVNVASGSRSVGLVPAAECAGGRRRAMHKLHSIGILGHEVYPVHLITRNSFGLMTRKLSVTESQRSAQFRGTFSRRKLSVASANWAHVA